MAQAKDNLSGLVCPQCQADNPLEARTCIRCGTSLVVARTQRYLNLTEADINAAHYDRARNNLAQADVEMLGLGIEARKQHLLTAHAFWLQGLLYYHMGQNSAAREELLLALQNLEEIAGGEELMARVLNRLGNIALYERTAEAADYYHRSSEIAASTGAHTIAATAMGNLGLLYAEDGRVEEALACYLAALNHAELSGDIQRLADTYRLIAAVYADEGPYNHAIKYINKALARCPEIADHASVCRIMSEAGFIYLKYGDLEQAEDLLHQAEDISRRTDYKLMQTATTIRLAELMQAKGDYSSSFNYANHTVNQSNLTSMQRSEAIVRLVFYYIDKKDWLHAHKYIQRLEQICASDSIINDLISLGRLQAQFNAAQGNWDEADRHFHSLMELAERVHNKYDHASFQEEYATQLLGNEQGRLNLDIRKRAYELLREVADQYQEMAMPLRMARVEAILSHV